MLTKHVQMDAGNGKGVKSENPKRVGVFRKWEGGDRII